MEEFSSKKRKDKESESYIENLLVAIDSILQNPDHEKYNRKELEMKIKDLQQKKYALIDNIIKQTKLNKDEKIKYFTKLLNFGNILENKYSREECKKYLAWHILIGSTPTKEEIKFFDFEGEDSIVNFVNDFYNELIEESKEKDNR
jgi:uncharacterized membrane protein YqiK